METLTTYDDVNSAWGGAALPPVTRVIAVAVHAKLVRKFGGRDWRPTRRGRRCWAAPKGSDTRHPRANGIPRMVHDASHYVFAKLHPTFLTHSAAHAKLEKQMIEHVLAKGWHLPKPAKPKPTPEDRRALALARTEAAIKRWTTKAKRAATALKKLRAKQRRLHAATK